MTKRPHVAGLALALVCSSRLVASAQAGAPVSKGGRSADLSRAGQIAFDRRSHLAIGRPGGRGPHRIFLVNADGSALRQLTSRGNAIQPDWSPNGREIAFSNGSPRGDILIMSANGTKARVVARGFATEPTFSPNGKSIAFGRPRTFTIWSVRTDGSHARKLLSNGEFPDWSPDGKHLAFGARDTNGLDIYVASSTGGGRTQLTQDGGAFYPAWSPNGKQIAFIDSGESWELRVLNVSGGSSRLLASNVSGRARPTWSPDGKRIAFVKYGRTHELIVTVSATGGGLKTVTRMTGDSNGVSWRR